MPFMERFELPLERQIIKAGGSIPLKFDTRQISGLQVKNARVKLRLRGDVQLHPSWMYEGGLPFLYRDIDDALTAETHHSRFALELAARGEPWPRRAHYKIQCPPKINTQFPVPQGGGPWRFSCWVWTEGLRLAEDGRAAVVFSHFWKKEGVDPRDISGEPEETVALPLPEGTGGWRRIACDVPLGERSAAMLVTIALEHAWGTVRLEDPVLENGLGFNILPPIDRANRFLECFNWYGENLSRKEWTALRLTVNGTELPEYALFQRCYRGSENELELPDGVLRDGENRLELCNASRWNDPLPYCVEKAELLVERRAPVRLAWCPGTAAAGRTFGLLLKTYAPEVRVAVSVSPGLEAPAELTCREPGLHVLQVRAGAPGGERRIVLRAEGHQETAVLDRVVEKEDDGVLAGSGDAIYIPQETGEMEDFLIWYLENGLGNMLTFRPVYRWSGTRECNEAMWRHMAALCEGLGLRWCHMIDGREIPGLNANPTKAMLAGEGFLGNQAHERDGALYYWLQRKGHASDILFEELSHRVLRHPDFPAYHPAAIYDEGNVYLCFSPTAPGDMREAADQFVNKARNILLGVKRHTGPSVLFKYFFQAGLEVGGAELMYGPLEVVLAALRGASAAYGREKFAAHLAVQWDKIEGLYFEAYGPDFAALRRNMPEGMLAVGGVGNGVFECVQDLVGYMDLCYLREDEPELYEALFRRVGQVSLSIWKRFLEEYGDVCCVCRFGDDLGFKSNTLLSAEDIRRCIIPEYRQIIGAVHETGKPFLLHSCGRIFNVMEDLINAGIDAKHSNEDQIARFPEWAERYGGRIGNFGGIDTDAVCRLPEREMEAYIQNVVRSCRGFGGFAFGSGNSIPDYVPVEQYRCMVRCVRRLRGEDV